MGNVLRTLERNSRKEKKNGILNTEMLLATWLRNCIRWNRKHRILCFCCRRFDSAPLYGDAGRNHRVSLPDLSSHQEGKEGAERPPGEAGSPEGAAGFETRKDLSWNCWCETYNPGPISDSAHRLLAVMSR